MSQVILGLDIGGANLKAATSDGRAVSVPFAVWKHPEKLGDELAKLIGQFPDATSLAVTMTAELCDCYETKREGVTRIVKDLQSAAKKLPIRIWTTKGKFVTPKVAIANYMKVAAANWHALATYAGRYVPKGPALLIDMGTTTTDIIAIRNGIPHTMGLTDRDRLSHMELLYMGWKRTPATSILSTHLAATEFFASCQDAYIVRKHVSANVNDIDTADGRPAIIRNSFSRLARMICGDIDTVSKRELLGVADTIISRQISVLRCNVLFIQNVQLQFARDPFPLIISGSGAFLIEIALGKSKYTEPKLRPFSTHIKLTDQIGSELAEAAPAYAVAVLAAEAGL